MDHFFGDSDWRTKIDNYVGSKATEKCKGDLEVYCGEFYGEAVFPKNNPIQTIEAVMNFHKCKEKKKRVKKEKLETWKERSPEPKKKKPRNQKRSSEEDSKKEENLYDLEELEN